SSATQSDLPSAGPGYWPARGFRPHGCSSAYVDRILRGANPAELPVEGGDKVRDGGQPQNRKSDEADRPAWPARRRCRRDRIIWPLHLRRHRTAGCLYPGAYSRVASRPHHRTCRQTPAAGRLPSPLLVAAGGLMSYGADRVTAHGQAAYYID